MAEPALDVDALAPARAASRLVRIGGHALEAIGRARWETARAPDHLRIRTRAHRLRGVCGDLCRLHGFRFEVEGSLPDGPAVLVANHLSYVDPVVLASLSPCVPIAKAEIAGWPVLGGGARVLGAAFVRRGDVHSGARALRVGLRALASGVSVLGFPEGTTTRGNGLLPFRRGLFGIARLAGVPVVPIAIAYASPDVAWTGDEWFLPHYFRTAMRPETLVSIRVGVPLPSQAFRSTTNLVHTAHARIAELIRRSR